MHTLISRFKAGMNNRKLQRTIEILVLATTGLATVLAMIHTAFPLGSEYPALAMAALIPFGVWSAFPFVAMYIVIKRCMGNKSCWVALVDKIPGRVCGACSSRRSAVMHAGIAALCVYSFYVQWQLAGLPPDRAVFGYVLLPLYQMLGLIALLCVCAVLGPKPRETVQGIVSNVREGSGNVVRLSFKKGAARK